MEKIVQRLLGDADAANSVGNGNFVTVRVPPLSLSEHHSPFAPLGPTAQELLIAEDLEAMVATPLPR